MVLSFALLSLRFHFSTYQWLRFEGESGVLGVREEEEEEEEEDEEEQPIRWLEDRICWKKRLGDT